MSITNGIPLQAVGALVLLVLALYVRQKRRVQRYIDNIPGPKSRSWLGNFALMHDAVKGWDFFDELHKNYGSVARVTTPMGCNDILYVSDPLALNHIVKKDEHIWDDPPEIHIMLQMVLGNDGLGATKGPQHHRQRKFLNPVFGPSYLRHISPLFYEATHRFIDSMTTICADGPTELILSKVDMSHWGTRVSLELVGQGAIGFSLDTLAIDAKPNLYGEEMKQGFVALSTPISRLAVKYILPRIASINTPSFNTSLLSLANSPLVNIVKNFIRELDANSKRMFAEKKQAILAGDDGLSEQSSKGKDLITALIREHVLVDREDRCREEEATSHFRTLLFAATDTSSSSILRIIQLLAENPEAQNRVREEIRNAKAEADGDVSYEKLLALPYLDAVFRETLRLYPPASYVDRVAEADTVLPLAFPITGRDGKQIDELFIPKGTVATLSLVGVNKHTGVWGPDADEWKPERWLQGLPSTIKSSKMPGIYSHMMTFLDGKKHCLGYRYAQIEIKILISEVIGALQFDLTRITTNHLAYGFDPLAACR
ncbi:cytochrome P450 [Cyathus striatus]|nr:cytochrome P450 [Cyathus striatus]